MVLKIEYFDFLEFKNTPDALANKVISVLKSQSPVLVIKNFPESHNDNLLIEFSNILGKPIKEERNLEGGPVYRVEFNPDLSNKVYANTNLEFLCHTDCSEMENPPDTVLLLCEKSSSIGGESYLVLFDDIIKNFSHSEIGLLTEKAYPFKDNYFSIVEFTNNQPWIRYNRVSIDISTKFHDIAFEDNIVTLLDKLDDILDKNKIVFKLENNDCLINNNRSILHGRANFQENSERLLKRIRLNIN